MSRICANCGQPIEPGTQVCICGTPVPARRPDPRRAAKAKKAKQQKMIRMGILAAIALVLVIVLAVIIFGKSPWEKSLNKLGDVLFEGKPKKLVELAPDDYWIWSEKNKGIGKDAIKEQAETYVEEIHALYEKRYGEKIKFDYELVHETKWTDTMTEQAATALNKNYGIDKDSVKGGYTVYLRTTISGKDYEEFSECEAFDFVKIGSKCYPCSFSYVEPVAGANNQLNYSCTLLIADLLQNSPSYLKEIAKHITVS